MMGTIIIGYPGVGKSSVCGTANDIIDLESTFFHNEGESGWEDRYVDVAIDLARQGFIVCISSHETVIKNLKDKWNKLMPPVVMVFPDHNDEMFTKWLKRLETRYYESRNNDDIPHWVIDKNYRAWKHVERNYREEVCNLKRMDVPFLKYIIGDINQGMSNVIEFLYGKYEKEEQIDEHSRHDEGRL